MTSVFAEGPSLITLALGKGKSAKGLYGLATIDDIVRKLQELPKEISLEYQSRALKKAAKPGQDALRQQVASVGQVTGNLLASVTRLDRKYTNNKAGLPVSVVVVGFRRPTGQGSQKGAVPAFNGGGVLKGPNRAYHSHLVEYGTRSKTPGIKSVSKRRSRVILGGRIRTIVQREQRLTDAAGRGILSSGFKPGGNTKGKRRAFKGRGQYPIDFIATGTVRGSPAQRPLQKAFNQSKATMQSILDVEMRKALTAAAREYKKKYGGSG